MRDILLDYLLLVLAGLMYAAALKYFVLPSEVILTGTEGVAASLSYFVESPALFIVLYLVFQLALLVFAWLKIGRVFTVRTLTVVLTVVTGLALLPELQFADPAPENERLILVIFGGLIAGVAKALAFQRRGSTGDEDIPGAFFALKYLRPVGSIAVVAATLSTGFGMVLAYIKTGEIEPVVNTLMYTCIYIFASAETLNNLYKKFKLARLTVVTQNTKKVGQAILDTLPHRTYVVHDGVGGRSGGEYAMVQTILTHEELPDVLRAIETVDTGCFYFHHDVEGVSRRYYITPIGATRSKV